MTLISLYTLSFKEVVLVVVMKTLLTFLGDVLNLPLVEWARLSTLSGMYLVMQLGEKRVSMIGVSAYRWNFPRVRSINGCELDGKIMGELLLYLPAYMSIVGIFAGIA